MKKYINIANILTFSRIILGFFFLIIFYLIKFGNINYFNIFIYEIISILIFIIAIITDALDGYYARKKNTVTNFGKHFDPLSDSIFFIIVFISFFLMGLLPWFFLIIIILREGFMHIFLRPFYKKKGQYLPASIFGKIKTFFQSIFSLIIILLLTIHSYLSFKAINYPFLELQHNSPLVILSYSFFGIIAFLSLFSLITYLNHFRNTFLKR